MHIEGVANSIDYVYGIDFVVGPYIMLFEFIDEVVDVDFVAAVRTRRRNYSRNKTVTTNAKYNCGQYYLKNKRQVSGIECECRTYPVSTQKTILQFSIASGAKTLILL